MSKRQVTHLSAQPPATNVQARQNRNVGDLLPQPLRRGGILEPLSLRQLLRLLLRCLKHRLRRARVSLDPVPDHGAQAGAGTDGEEAVRTDTIDALHCTAHSPVDAARARNGDRERLPELDRSCAHVAARHTAVSSCHAALALGRLARCLLHVEKVAVPLALEGVYDGALFQRAQLVQRAVSGGEAASVAAGSRGWSALTGGHAGPCASSLPAAGRPPPRLPCAPQPPVEGAQVRG